MTAIATTGASVIGIDETTGASETATTATTGIVMHAITGTIARKRARVRTAVAAGSMDAGEAEASGCNLTVLRAAGGRRSGGLRHARQHTGLAQVQEPSEDFLLAALVAGFDELVVDAIELGGVREIVDGRTRLAVKIQEQSIKLAEIVIRLEDIRWSHDLLHVNAQ